MKVVIIEIYTSLDDDGTKTVNIENVYGVYDDDKINDKIIELENLRKSYNTTFEIMPLIRK